MILLLSSRLRLIPLRPEHAEALFAGLRDKILYEFIDDEPPESVAALRSRIQRLATRRSPDGSQVWLNWALWICEEARYAGYVQATILESRAAQIAYVLFRDAWDNGYAREAVAAMLAHLREHWNVSTFHASVDPRNSRSVAVLSALGFTHVGRQSGQRDFHGVLVDESEDLLLMV